MNEMNTLAIEARRRRRSIARCAGCGHLESQHGISDTMGRGCYWSEGSGPNYEDCQCDCFNPLASDNPVSSEPFALEFMGGARSLGGEQLTLAGMSCEKPAELARDPRQTELF